MTEITLFADVEELANVEPSKADMIRQTFTAMADTLKGFEEQYNTLKAEAATEITPDVTARAKRLRLDISKVRIETEKARKAQKEQYLRAGQAIDAVAKTLNWAVADKESTLKEIEEHFERLEAARLEALQAARAEALSPYADPTGRDLAGMAEDVWDAFLSTKRKDHDDRIEAERLAEEKRQDEIRKAEADRIAREKAEAQERERLRAENERLQKEAAEKDRLAKIEEEKRQKAEAAERAKREAEDNARREKEAEERKAREAEEARRLAEIEKARQAELAKGDKEKAADLITDLEAVARDYAFESKEYQAMYRRVVACINQAIEIAEM